MREIRPSGLEGGGAVTPLSLPLSQKSSRLATISRDTDRLDRGMDYTRFPPRPSPLVCVYRVSLPLTQLSQLASDFGNFWSGDCEFPRNSRSFSVPLRLVQTYPLPLQRAALVNWPLSKWARPFCKAIIGS